MNPFIKNKKQISIFITAGYPALESTIEQIISLQESGIDFIEVGIPFSDPMADGPVIQETSSIALANGMDLNLLFNQLKSIKSQIHTPLVLMGYLNPVLQFGLEKFLQLCQELSIASVILPDMSLEIYERFYKSKFDHYSMPVTFLITPLTEDERIVKIKNMSRKSFVYLVSNTSITGGKLITDINIVNRYDKIKKLCGDTPVMMGFGISTAADVKMAQNHCDGAIIGSAYLKALRSGESLRFIEEVCS